MATKLYLHRTEITTPTGLPTTEQSSLAPDANLFDNEDGSENRSMDKTISAVSQTTLTNSSTADTNAHNYYIARWVSPVLAQTSVSANTWTLEFGATESNANANFPRNGAGALRVCCYVWKPSNGTKYGNILDGNTAANGEEAGTSQTVINCTFSGSAVSSLTSGDAVIVFELWAIVTQGNGTSRTQTIAYDGTTENSTSNMAARLETPENLAFQYPAAISQSISISPAVAEAALKLRSISQSISISPAIAIAKILVRSISESISISPAVAKIATFFRTPNDSISISPAIDRVATKFRTISDTITIADSVNRLKTAIRDISQSISIVDSVVREFIPAAGGQLFERAINESIAIADSINKVATKLRSISQSITIADSVNRVKTAIIAIPQSISIIDSVLRQALLNRTINQSITIADSINRTVIRIRAISQSINISDSINRFKLAIINIGETITITDIVTVPITDIVRILTGGGAGGRRLMKDWSTGLRIKKRNFKLRRWFKR